MSNSTFYVTTPIYYVNDKPHIGHAYTTVLADVLARYHRAAGDDVWFLTGTDEHGQKVQKAAEKNGMTPIEQCNSTVVRFQELWKRLGITNDDFIRTTEERHWKIVQAIMQDLYDRDLIYKAEYKGYYCVACERFFTEKDLIDGKLCPDCQREVDTIVESNYFFRMSKYQDWLIQYITEHPDFIQPAFRANETLGFLRKPLEDLCISRPKSRLSWGIELPFDKDYVCYVWFDLLDQLHPPDRKGHPHHAQRVLADHAQGDRAPDAEDHLRARLVAHRQPQDEQVSGLADPVHHRAPGLHPARVPRQRDARIPPQAAGRPLHLASEVPPLLGHRAAVR